MESSRDEEKINTEYYLEYNGLTFLDRRLLKAYFGYIDTEKIIKANKSKIECPESVRGLLWPQERENATAEEDKKFELREISDRGHSFISTIFEHNDTSLIDMLKDGRKRTAAEQESIVRLFQVSKTVF